MERYVCTGINSMTCLYKVVDQPQESVHRSLILRRLQSPHAQSLTWSGDRKPCLYAGMSQGDRHAHQRQGFGNRGPCMYPSITCIPCTQQIMCSRNLSLQDVSLALHSTVCVC